MWAGLLATKDSPDVWSRLLSKKCEFLELGVFLEESYYEKTSSSGPPLIGLKGTPLQMYFHRANGSTWTNAPPIAAPSTYTVSCINYTAMKHSHIVLYRSVESAHCPVSKNWVSLIILAVLSKRSQKGCTFRYMISLFQNLLNSTPLITKDASKDMRTLTMVLASSYHIVRNALS